MQKMIIRLATDPEENVLPFYYNNCFYRLFAK